MKMIFAATEKGKTMSDREKLIELLDAGLDMIDRGSLPFAVEMLADHLIANGVTVQQCLQEELEFTRQFIHDNGLEFELAAAWERRKRGQEST